jgi:hypothetical protein
MGLLILLVIVALLLVFLFSLAAIAVGVMIMIAVLGGTALVAFLAVTEASGSPGLGALAALLAAGGVWMYFERKGNAEEEAKKAQAASPPKT